MAQEGPTTTEDKITNLVLGITLWYKTHQGDTSQAVKFSELISHIESQKSGSEKTDSSEIEDRYKEYLSNMVMQPDGLAGLMNHVISTKKEDLPKTVFKIEVELKCGRNKQVKMLYLNTTLLTLKDANKDNSEHALFDVYPADVLDLIEESLNKAVIKIGDFGGYEAFTSLENQLNCKYDVKQKRWVVEKFILPKY